MENNLMKDFINKNFKGASVKKIEPDASNRTYYRVIIKEKSFTLKNAKIIFQLLFSYQSQEREEM